MIMTHPIDPATNLRAGLIQIPTEVCKEAGYELYDEETALALHLKHKRETEEYLQSKMPEDLSQTPAMPASGKGKEEDEDLGPSPMDDEEDEISQAERDASKFLNVRDDQKIR